MAAQVVRKLSTPPTAEQLLTRVRAMASRESLAEDPKRLRLDHPHFRERLAGRKLTMRHVLETVRKGVPVKEPTLDRYGDWRIKLRRKVAGRRVQVVVAVKADHFVLVTAI